MYLSPSQSPNVTFCPVTEGSWRKGNKAFSFFFFCTVGFLVLLLACAANVESRLPEMIIAHCWLQAFVLVQL